TTAGLSCSATRTTTLEKASRASASCGSGPAGCGSEIPSPPFVMKWCQKRDMMMVPPLSSAALIVNKRARDQSLGFPRPASDSPCCTATFRLGAHSVRRYNRSPWYGQPRGKRKVSPGRRSFAYDPSSEERENTNGCPSPFLLVEPVCRFVLRG